MDNNIKIVVAEEHKKQLDDANVSQEIREV